MAAMGEEVRLWCSSLPIARVTRWGEMMMNGCAYQTMIQTALTGSGCPDRLVSELMSNAHERRWPPGKEACRCHFTKPLTNLAWFFPTV